MARMTLLLFFLLGSLQAMAGNNNINALKEGDQAPEIALPGPNGDTIRLSSLKGRMVLIDFWATWCAPCRENNVALVKIYQQYNRRNYKKGVGFEIFSVSLDQKKEDWQKGIHDQNLSWPYQVCDFQKWGGKTANAYGVAFIPFNVLIDGYGKVITVNVNAKELKSYLRAEALKE